ncbi:MAG: hypothetical protein QXS20_05710 [Candidatus Thorarchaeota archaeon]
MRITGTQYSLERKSDSIEMKSAGKVTDTWDAKGKTMDEMTDEIWNALKRKGVTVQRNAIAETLQSLFPNARKHGPLA